MSIRWVLHELRYVIDITCFFPDVSTGIQERHCDPANAGVL